MGPRAGRTISADLGCLTVNMTLLSACLGRQYFNVLEKSKGPIGRMFGRLFADRVPPPHWAAAWRFSIRDNAKRKSPDTAAHAHCEVCGARNNRIARNDPQLVPSDVLDNIIDDVVCSTSSLMCQLFVWVLNKKGDAMLQLL